MKTRVILLMSFIFLASFYSEAKENVRVKRNDWDSREHFYKSKDSFSAYEIEYKGKISVSDNDKNVKAISPNGYLKITKSSFGNSRTIKIESDDKGNLTKKYLEGKKEIAFEPEGQEWLEEILIDVIRKTGIGGKERILRFYNKGGVNAVLDEIEDFERSSGYSYYKTTNHAIFYFQSVEYSGLNVKYLYYKTLVNEINLSKEEVVKVLKALTDISSNSTKGTLLRAILDKYELDSYSMEKFLDVTETLSYNTERGNTLRAFIKKYDITTENSREFFDVIEGMSVNPEKGNVIKPLLASQKLDKRVLSDLIEVVDDFSSNSERAAIYRILVPHVVGDEDLTTQLIYAVKNLSSSYHLLGEEVLEYIAKGKVVTDNNLSKSAVLNILDIARSYDANTKKSPTLRSLHGSMTTDKEVLEAYFDVINSMDITRVKYNLLQDFIRDHKLDNTGLIYLLDEIEEIANEDEQHAAAAILRMLIKDLPNDPEVVKYFFDALDEIDQNSSKEEIIRMFCERGKLDKRTIVYLLKTVEDIDVDIEKATSLMNIKKVMPKGDDELTYIFNSVADDIKSDYEYERAMN
ncbi:MAG: hypothetical protein K8R31_10565 [Bacteroidales bacterium]|nr:hypothetical protein [Bacteroidales bacterium]